MQRWTRSVLGWLAVAAVAAAPAMADDGAAVAGGAVSGIVSIAGADGAAAIPGVTVTLDCTPAVAPLVTISDAEGKYKFTAVPVATCTIAADLQGFRSAVRAVTIESGTDLSVALQLGLDTLTEQVTVPGTAEAAADGAIASHVERLTTSEMLTAPLASERFQDALPLIPGVVRGPDGLLNINGSRTNQSALEFNDADATDPVTGEHAIELPIDGVRSVQVHRTAYAPEFGDSIGAVTTVETQQAGAAWHVTLNDLEPRLRRRRGEFHGIESFTPRVTVGGPLAPRVSLLQSTQYELSRTQVFSLPPLESDTQVESVESFSRMDWTASPANRFAATMTASPRTTTYAGLNTFNPQSVTPTIENRGVLVTAADQIVVAGTGVLDLRAGVKQFDATIHPSRGTGAMILAPDRNAGSYFNNQDRRSRRVEWSGTYAVSPIGPAHLMKLGAGFVHERFSGTNANRPVEIVRADGTVDQRITFSGSTALGATKAALAGYAQDDWTVGRRLTVQGGGRYDYDSITSEWHVAPRGSGTALLSADGRTVARGGWGLFYNPIALNVAAFDQMQTRIVSRYGADGGTLVGDPIALPNVMVAPLRAPRAIGWNVEIDREWIRDLFVRVGYQQRDSRHESVVDAATPVGRPVLALRPDGSSRYREAQVTARYRFYGADQLVASYTRSSAVGNLNEFNAFFGNIENPVIRADERAPLPWDAPNHVLVWANLSLPKSISVFPLVDVRTGFPTSILDEEREFVGPRNSHRFPTFVSLDTQVSKRFRLFGHNATVGIKMFNITNHFNPRDFQGNVASAAFGGFANGVGRTFRGRWIFEF